MCTLLCSPARRSCSLKKLKFSNVVDSNTDLQLTKSKFVAKSWKISAKTAANWKQSLQYYAVIYADSNKQTINFSSKIELKCFKWANLDFFTDNVRQGQIIRGAVLVCFSASISIKTSISRLFIIPLLIELHLNHSSVMRRNVGPRRLATRVRFHAKAW